MFYEETLAVVKIQRLYEQKQTAPERASMLDDYLSRWERWVYAGLHPVALLPPLMPCETQAC
jgi:hypothetical protein